MGVSRIKNLLFKEFYIFIKTLANNNTIAYNHLKYSKATLRITINCIENVIQLNNASFC